MADLQLNAQGVVVPCRTCGQRNRLDLKRLAAAHRCPSCKNPLPRPDVPMEVPDARTFDAAVAQSALPVVVDFWAPWCGPCRMVAPELEKVAKKMAGRYLIVKVNTDAIPELGERFRHPLHTDDGGLCRRERGGSHGRRAARGRHRGLRRGGVEVGRGRCANIVDTVGPFRTVVVAPGCFRPRASSVRRRGGRRRRRGDRRAGDGRCCRDRAGARRSAGGASNRAAAAARRIAGAVTVGRRRCALGRGSRPAPRRLRRVPASRGHPRIAHGGRAPRDSVRDGPHPRDRQPPQGVFHRRRGPLRRTRRSRGRDSDRSVRRPSTRRASVCAAGTRIDRMTALARRRRRHRSSGTSAWRWRWRSRRRQRGHRADGPVGADGEGRPADERQGSARRRLRAAGILPASAPLAVSTLTVAGLALAFSQQGEGRVAVSFIGEGGSSLGEWHEAINLCAARRLPAVFCVQNNQTALSTPVPDQSAARVFAEKAAGYGIPGLTIDGTDPDEIAAAFAWAVERARDGPGTGADRAGLHAHVRACASRRHALPGQAIRSRDGSTLR